MSIAPGRFCQGANHVEPPDREGPRDGYGLERLHRHVRLPSIKLAPFAGAHDLFGVSDCRWPIKPLAECVPDQDSWRSVMSTDSALDVNQQLPSLLDGDATL